MSPSDQLSSLEADLAELNALSTRASRCSVKQLMSSLILQVESQIGFLKQSTQSACSKRSTTSSSTSNTCFNKIIKVYGWDQTNDRIRLLVTSGITGVSSLAGTDQVKCDFNERGFKLVIERLSGANHVLEIRNLLHRIKCDDSNVKVLKGDVVQISMAKSESKKWEYLTEADKQSSERRKPKFDPVDEKQDPQEGLMKMMKKMYEEGDDEMKRTIAKAWTESREKSMNSS
ncbi:hypothetical protein ACOME3_008424 [Neoechinorhynchus agilis]